MTLFQQQRLFPPLVAKLIIWAYANGYEVTFAEAYRTPEQAALNAQKGSGILWTLHTQRLAIDLNLFKDGIYLAKTADYKPLGDYWKTLHPLACWGGDFTKPDGDHFSLMFGGIK